jgi:hypothetical protein
MQITIHGMVRPDGSLELTGLPALPAGPVEIVIRSAPSRPDSVDWWSFLQRARGELESAGHTFRTKEDIDAEIDELRADAN